MKYTADFETTTDPKDCRVWSYALCEIGNTDNFHYGLNIKDFIEWCYNQSEGKKGKSPILYFHNLKFDIEFILYELFKQGYEFSAKVKKDKSFNTIISSLGQVYRLEIIFEKKNKKYRKVTIYDSFKKLPFSVDRIAKAFELPILKLDLDYHKFRPIGYVPTLEELAYIRNDVEIMARALDIQFKQGLTKMTIGSDAMTDYKERIGGITFESTFPIFSFEADDDLRQTYKGGFCYLLDKWKEVEIGKGLQLDVNSLYPYVMRTKLLPFGHGVYFKGKYVEDPLYPLYTQKIITKFKVKKDHIPTIQIKRNSAFKSTEYIRYVTDEVVLRLTNIDLQLFLDHYDVEYIEYCGGWKFKGVHDLFNDYIDYWAEIKKNSTGALRELAKLMLNNLYGKFGTNPDITGKIPYYDQDEDVVKYKLGEKETKDACYVIMASFITAYAREITIRAGQDNFKRFIYSDTDSLHLTGWNLPKNIKIDPKEFGYWSLEYKFTRAKYIKQKTYINEVDGKLIVKCASMTSDLKKHINFDNFKTGNVFSTKDLKDIELKKGQKLIHVPKGKLRQTRVKGGVILADIEFTIS